MRDIHLSIVSHGHSRHVESLLADLAGLPCIDRCQLTLIENLAEAAMAALPDCRCPVKVMNNRHPRGFGANHNLAFRAAPLPEERRWFVVLNPDLHIRSDVLSPLTALLEESPGVGVAAPGVVSVSGAPEDSARELPTPLRLLRKLAGRSGAWPVGETDRPFHPDWIAGMFMLFRAEVFEEVGGFDEGFFLYYEDVDICSRLWLNGYSVLVDPSLSIIHDAQRTSRKNWRYARWHLASMLRFFTSDVYRRARRLHRQRRASA